MALKSRECQFTLSKKKHLVAQAVISALAITPLWLSAAEVESAADNSVKESEIEVVTVTAQKRVQNILKVPVTVGSVSADEIEESGSVLLSDIDKFIPGFDFSDGNMTQAGVTMRGVSSPNISVGGDPSSATFYDDVYMPRAAQNVIFSDMARIEVLKGPQGTLFGRNAAMGVVNMVPNSPGSEFDGFIKATLGTDNLQRYEGMINIPLSDSIYMRANVLTNNQDGLVENVATPNWNDGTKIWDLGERAHNAARLSLLWDISSTTNFQLSYDFDDLEQAPPMAVGVSEYAYNGGKTPFADKAENDIRHGVEARDMYGITAKLNHEFNNALSMKYVLSYRDWQTENREDEDGTADITRYFDTSNNEDSDILYTELQFNYVSDKINAVAGFSYSKESVSQTTELNFTTDTAARLITGDLNNQINGLVSQQIAGMLGGNTDAHAAAAFGPGVTFDGAVQTIKSTMGLEEMDHMWNPDDWSRTLIGLGYEDQIIGALVGLGIVPAGTPLTPELIEMTGNLTYDMIATELPALVGSDQIYVPEIFGPGYSGQFWQETVNNTGEFTNWGVYADVDYSITDKWNIIGGVRYSKDEKDFTWLIPLNNFSGVPVNQVVEMMAPGLGNSEQINNVIFPQADLTSSDSWDKVTGRLVTSYQLNDDHMVFASYSTGYKSGGYDSLLPSMESFSPENTSDLELGYKAIVWGEVVANISGYFLEITDLQSSISSAAEPGAPAIPTIISADKDITGIEFDVRWFATESLTLGMVSEIRSTDTYTPDFRNGEGELIKAQKSSSDANLNYTLTIDWMPDFGVGTTNFHVDYVFLENTNASQAGLEDYKKAIPEYFKDTKNLNARLSWSNDDDNVEIGLWGKNLLDERYMLSVGGLTADLLGTPHGQINRGMEAGIDVKYTF